MHNLSQLKRECEQRIEETIQKVEAHYDIEFPRVPIVWSRKMTSTAGTARYSRLTYKPVRITLSEPLLKLNPTEFVDDTPAHEAVHLLANFIHQTDCGHGPKWKSMMRLVGAPTDRTHNMETPKTGTAHHCRCRVYHLGPVRTRKIANGLAYTCKTCKHKLVRGMGPFQSASDRVEVRPEKPQEKLFRPETESGTKSSMVRDWIRKFQKSGIMDANVICGSDKIMSEICASTGLDLALARKYVRNNWSKV
jgi:predicted SprT family Zn-dependent metalloprotease